MAGRVRVRVLTRPTARAGAVRLAALGAIAALLAAMLPALVASAAPPRHRPPRATTAATTPIRSCWSA